MRHVPLSAKVPARWFVLALALVVACGGGNDERSEATACERVRDHLVELRLAGVEADVEAHRSTMKQMLGDKFIERCAAELTTKQVQCALAARDSARAMECTGVSVSRAD